MGDGDEPRALIDRLEQPIEVDGDAVLARHDDDASAQAFREPVVDVAHRGKVELRHHDRIARRRVVDRRKHRGLGECDVRKHHDFSRIGTDERRDLVTHGDRHLPPAPGPRLHTLLRPEVDVLGEPVGDTARHRT